MRTCCSGSPLVEVTAHGLWKAARLRHFRGFWNNHLQGIAFQLVSPHRQSPLTKHPTYVRRRNVSGPVCKLALQRRANTASAIQMMVWRTCAEVSAYADQGSTGPRQVQYAPYPDDPGRSHRN